MEPSTQVILSGLLTFGVPLLLAIRELYVMRRPPGGSWDNDGPPPPVPPPIPPDATPMKPLPECLIPRPMSDAPKRARVLELV